MLSRAAPGRRPYAAAVRVQGYCYVGSIGVVFTVRPGRVAPRPGPLPTHLRPLSGATVCGCARLTSAVAHRLSISRRRPAPRRAPRSGWRGRINTGERWCKKGGFSTEEKYVTLLTLPGTLYSIVSIFSIVGYNQQDGWVHN